MKRSIIAVSIFFAALSILVVLNRLHAVVPCLYFLIGLITYVMYAGDKTAAEKGKWRTPEKVLHFLSLFGGWPGALLAQQHLRHKTVKLSFQIVYWITAILNCGTLIYFLILTAE